jgi:hypothetical protein
VNLDDLVDVCIVATMVGARPSVSGTYRKWYSDVVAN